MQLFFKMFTRQWFALASLVPGTVSGTTTVGAYYLLTDWYSLFVLISYAYLYYGFPTLKQNLL